MRSSRPTRLPLPGDLYNGRLDTGGPDYGARLNQLFGSVGIFTFQYAQHKDRFVTKPFGLDVPTVRDYTTDPSGTGTNFTVTGGFGQVFGPTVNNESKRDAFSGSFTAYLQNHEIKVGGDYQKDTTFGSTYFTGGSAFASVRAASTDEAMHRRRSALYERERPDQQVFYQHDLLANGTNANSRSSRPRRSTLRRSATAGSSRTSGGSSRR